MGERETPWALVQRLRAEGAAIEQIVASLMERGLARDDLEALLHDDEAYRRWARGQAAKPVAEAPPRASAPPSDVGRIVRWFVISVSLLAAGVGLAWASSLVGVLVALGAALPALGLLVVEFRRGVRRTVKPLGFVCFFAFIAAAVSGFISGWDAAAILGGAIFLSSVPMIVWASRTGAQLPGIPDFVAEAAVFETDDVQFAVSWNAEPVGPGEFVMVRLVAQNCVDVARRVQFDVKVSARSPVTPLTYIEAIDPGCIIEVALPVPVPPIADRAFSFTIIPQVSGTRAGQRVRLTRGHDWVTPNEAVLTNVLGVASLVGLGAGVFQLGSNGVITVQVDDARATQISTRPVTSKALFRPTESQLRAAATS